MVRDILTKEGDIGKEYMILSKLDEIMRTCELCKVAEPDLIVTSI